MDPKQCVLAAPWKKGTRPADRQQPHFSRPTRTMREHQAEHAGAGQVEPCEVPRRAISSLSASASSKDAIWSSPAFAAGSLVSPERRRASSAVVRIAEIASWLANRAPVSSRR
jgi:hypothetical protein